MLASISEVGVCALFQASLARVLNPFPAHREKLYPAAGSFMRVRFTISAGQRCIRCAYPGLVNLRVHPPCSKMNERKRDSLYVDVAALIRDGANAPEPDIMPLTEDSYLFYSGEFNLIFGDSESGKTWLALAALTDVLKQGGRAAFIDLDHNGAPSVVSRLRDFGVNDDLLCDQQQFRLTQDDGIELREVIQDLAVFVPDLVVLDSLGEALNLYRYDSNDGGDFTTAHTMIIKPLTRGGAGVLVIDHLAKNAGSRELGPTGTPAKLRAVGGTALRVTAEQPFRPGEGGSAKLELFKDRHGGVRRQFPRHGIKPVIGTFKLGVDDDGLTYSVDPGLTVSLDKQKAENAKTAAQDAEKLAHLNLADMSVRSVRRALNCGQPRAQRAITAYQKSKAV